MKPFICLLLCSLPLLAAAQQGNAPVFSAAVFNNATMLPPASLTATFNQPLHPGVALAWEFGWKEKGRHKWFQNATLGYYHHRYAFQSFLLYSQAGYRRYFGKFSAEFSLQAGYMHQFPLTDRAVRLPDGTWEDRSGGGKPQFIFGAGLGLGYNLGSAEKLRRLFLAYDVRMQMPFVSGYVPLLPNGALLLGLQFSMLR